jgi:hypothetical protein
MADRISYRLPIKTWDTSTSPQQLNTGQVHAPKHTQNAYPARAKPTFITCPGLPVKQLGQLE